VHVEGTILVGFLPLEGGDALLGQLHAENPLNDSYRSVTSSSIWQITATIPSLTFAPVKKIARKT
jgi:hypothetical protein